jgi:hypothetical protein
MSPSFRIFNHEDNGWFQIVTFTCITQNYNRTGTIKTFESGLHFKYLCTDTINLWPTIRRKVNSENA